MSERIPNVDTEEEEKKSQISLNDTISTISSFTSMSNSSESNSEIEQLSVAESQSSEEISSDENQTDEFEDEYVDIGRHT